jgi:putative transposase
MAVLWRLRHKLSLRDVAEMLVLRGFDVTHETIRAWEFRFAPLVAERLRARRR